jgi:hypothetical protein
VATLAVVLGGCGDGRKAPQAFVTADPAPAVTTSTPAPVPPIIGGGDVAAIQASSTPPAKTIAAKPDPVAAKTELRLRRQRDAANRARRRSALRERVLRRQLAAATAPAAKPTARPKPPAVPSPAIAGSDVSAVAPDEPHAHEDELAARRAVVGFHDLINKRDVRACDMLSAGMLRATYGAGPDARTRCQATVRAFPASLSVVITDSRIDGAAFVVKALEQLDDKHRKVTLTVLHVGTGWFIDSLKAGPTY